MIGKPNDPITEPMLKEFEQQLSENKVCALIVQFGEKEHDYTADKKIFHHMRLLEIDINNEFMNEYFQFAFKRIMKEFTALFDWHQIN